MSNGLLGTYIPSQVTIVISSPTLGINHVLTHFGEDTFVNLELPQDTWTEKESIDGYTTRSHHMTKTMRVTVTLDQASKSNDVLSGLHAFDAKSRRGEGIFTCTIADKSGRSYAYSSQCYVKKPQNQEFGAQSGTRSWVIVMAGTDSYIGGNTVLDQDTVEILSKLGITVDETWTLSN